MLVSMTRELSCTTAAEALSCCAGLRAILCEFMRSTRKPLGNGSARGFSPLLMSAPCLPRKDNVCVAVRFPQCDIGTEAICACFQDVSHRERDGRPSQNCNAQNCIEKKKNAREKDKRKARLAAALVAARDARERCD